MGQTAGEKAASDRSCSTTTGADGPLSADTCNSVSSESAFLSAGQECDVPRMPLAFTTPTGGSLSPPEPPREMGGGLSPVPYQDREALEVATLTAQLKTLDMQSGCEPATGEVKPLGTEGGALQLSSPVPATELHSQTVSERGDVEAKSWVPTRTQEGTGGGASPVPGGHHMQQEGPRTRQRSNAFTPTCGGLKPNAVSYGCIFDALVSNGAMDLALKLLADMKASNQPVRPNTVMYSTLIKGCAQTKQASSPSPSPLERRLDQALSLFEEMAAQGVEINTVTYNSLLDVCARVGAMDRAASLLDDMLQKGVQPDLITFSTIIKGYCAHGQMDKGLLLLKAMKQKNINPDGVLYNSLLDGCVRSGRSSLCLELWQEMQAQRIKPSNFTLSILIKLHGRMRQLPVAFELVKQLPKMYDFRINAHVYTCLMAACIENRQIMRREGVAADSKTVSTIVFGCLKGRMHAQAVEVVLNALESVRESNSRGPGRHLSRGRPMGVGTNRKQDLPAIDEKTVRLLVYHLREQHMHRECTLVLEAAVSVGLMSRATAQSLLTGEGSSGRRLPFVSSAGPAGAFASPQPLTHQPHLPNAPPGGARLMGIRGGPHQGNARWQEPRGVHRHPTAGLHGGTPHRSVNSGAKEGYSLPAEVHLNLSTPQENPMASPGQPWSVERSPPQPPPTATVRRSQAMNSLQPGIEAKQRLLSLHPQDPLTLRAAGLLGDLPTQHLLQLPINGGILTGGNNVDLAPPSGRPLNLGSPPYIAEESVSTQGATLHTSVSMDLYGPGMVSESSCIWGAPAPGTTPPSSTGCGLFAMPSAVAHPPPRTVELPIDSNVLLGAGGSFFNEENCQLPGLPLSSPAYASGLGSKVKVPGGSNHPLYEMVLTSRVPLAYQPLSQVIIKGMAPASEDKQEAADPRRPICSVKFMLDETSQSALPHYRKTSHAIVSFQLLVSWLVPGVREMRHVRLRGPAAAAANAVIPQKSERSTAVISLSVGRRLQHPQTDNELV
ncbi:PPR repeat-containing protein, putative [Eimeria mitis]|uniref:PPR repeat-containing protein, putative n=1 Tax=Eimeria mitis TaxID=44415 RepID=U6JTV1_9EIME|nr:PPR repeat-containing protein, putative [Eimeria mitis]CDJ28870.1 PPR repeat-containing protein, putative [Eimeria mitis]